MGGRDVLWPVVPQVQPAELLHLAVMAPHCMLSSWVEAVAKDARERRAAAASASWEVEQYMVNRNR